MDKQQHSKSTASELSTPSTINNPQKSSSSTATSSNAIIPRTVRRITQNFLVVWLDTDFDESKDNYKKSMQHLHDISAIVATFTDVDECFDFLTDIYNEKVFLIVSDAIGNDIIQEMQECPQLVSIYVLCQNQSVHEQWLKTMPKVKGVHTQIQPICDALQVD
ncbi:unnamed protein product, partial [Rotaria sp. Silwood1]